MCLSCKGIAHYFAVGFHAWGLQWGLQWGSAGVLALLGVGSMCGGGSRCCSETCVAQLLLWVAEVLVG